MPSPKVSWTLDGLPVTVTGWSCNSVANGGFDQCRGTFRGSEWNRVLGTAVQGSMVRATLPNGIVMWEGHLSSPPAVQEGEAHFAAQGHKVALERRTERKLYRTRDYSLWASAADPPHNFVTNVVDDIEADVRNSCLYFKVNSGVTYAVGDMGVLVLWVPGVEITNVAATIGLIRTNTNFDVRIQKFVGPDGARTLVADYDLATAADTTINEAITGSYDAIAIGVRTSAGVTPGAAMTVRLRDLRIDALGVATTTASQVLTDIGVDAGLTMDTYTSSLAVMPLDWEGPWSDLADYVCMMDDATWRVLEDHRMECFKWANSPVWRVQRATGAKLDLTPLELFNKVTVNYPAQHGKNREVTVTASPDPLSGSGLTNAHYEELEDVQPDATLATSVATTMAAKLSAVRYEGTIELTSATDAGGRDAAWEVKGGDTVTIDDWGPGESKTLRVLEAEYTHEGVVIGIEQDVSSDRALGLAALRESQSRKKRKKRG